MNPNIKKNSQPTGSLKGLFTSIFVIIFIGCVLAFAVKLPTNILPSNAINKPQVEGQSTIEEYVAPEDKSEPYFATSDAKQSYYKVTNVVDGDTIKVSIADKIETVRLIGIDTPETKDPRKPVQCFGNEASSYTYKSLFNKSVKLVQDNSQQNRDKYGRLLRYVYLSDGTLFNLSLINLGYAYEYTYKVPYTYQTEFKDAAHEAQINNVGLWNKNTCNGKK